MTRGFMGRQNGVAGLRIHHVLFAGMADRELGSSLFGAGLYFGAREILLVIVTWADIVLEGDHSLLEFV